MWIHTFFKSLTSTPKRRRPTRRRTPVSRPCLETLEDRCLLSAVHALFDLGSPVSGPFASDRFTVTDTDPAVVLPADYTFTADDQGRHTFSGAFTLITPGDQTLTVADLADALSTDVPITVNA